MRLHRDEITTPLMVGAITALVLIGAWFLFGASPERSASKLRDLGYTNVVIGDRAYISAWACGKGVHYEYTATNPAGTRVKGIVCYPNFVKATTKEEPI